MITECWLLLLKSIRWNSLKDGWRRWRKWGLKKQNGPTRCELKWIGKTREAQWSCNKMLIDWFSPGLTGKYLALCHDLKPKIFPHSPPTQSISTYYRNPSWRSSNAHGLLLQQFISENYVLHYPHFTNLMVTVITTR